MASTLRPTPPPNSSSTDKGLPTAAYVMIGVGVYLFLVLLFIIIRRCLKSQGVSICPAWLSESFCGSCCGDVEQQQSCLCACLVPLAEMCDCAAPSKKSCLDTVCPSKQWCDDTFCCCMNAEPGGAMCQDCKGPECSLGACNCACNCSAPECDSINCLCFTIDLSGGQGAQRQQQDQVELQRQIEQLQQLQMQQQIQQQQQAYPR